MPVELGVCVLEDQHQFILHHQSMWNETDDTVALAMVEATQARYPDLQQCSFDNGFYTPANRDGLESLLEQIMSPKKGRLSAQDKEREYRDDFIQARHQHCA